MRGILLAVLLAPSLASAGNGGSEPLNFLFLDGSARSAGMGGAYTALANDSNALLYNPGGLGMIERHEATFMHSQHFESVNQEYVGLALRSGLGFNLNYLNYPQTQRTTYDTFDGTLGTVSGYDLSTAGGYGFKLADDLSLGGAFKYIRSQIDVNAADAYAVDVGAMYKPSGLPGLTVGLAAQDIGPDIRYKGVGFSGPRQMLPLNARGGAAYGFNFLGMEHIVAVDLAKIRGADTVAGVGWEGIIAHSFALRMGFNSRNSSDLGLSGGLGWTYGAFALDYAVIPFGDLGFTHRLSAAVRWGGPSVEPEAGYRDKRIKAPAAEHEEDRPEDMSAEAHFRRADRAIAFGGRLWEARRELGEAKLLLGPKDQLMVRYWQLMGNIWYQERAFAKAQASYTEALRLAASLEFKDKSVADAFMGVGLCLIEQKNPEYAIKFFRRGLNAGPSEQTRRFLERKIKELEEAEPQ